MLYSIVTKQKKQAPSLVKVVFFAVKVKQLNKKEVREMEKILEFRPPRIAVGLLALSAILSHLSPDRTVLHFPYKFAGTVGILAGFVIMMLAWLGFKKVKTAVCHIGKPTVLVTDGVYRMTRNPMYLGMLLMLAGASFLIGDVPAFIAPVAFYLMLDKVFIPYEEEKMTFLFSDEYQGYAKRTRRWL